MPTVVFADLVGSTSLYERLGDATASAFVMELTKGLQQSFEAHQGRVVKLLGDGLFVVFQSGGDALAACVSIQKNLADIPLLAGGVGAPIQVQIGMDSGEVVEINGDCFGDTVNTAARLADLAGGGQILATQHVWAALPPLQKVSLRSIGPMYLRGRAEASHVYRIEWQTGRDEEVTMMGGLSHAGSRTAILELGFDGRAVQCDAQSGQMTIGRALDAGLSVNDPRVSRLHATLQWRGGNFVLTDASSYGTWVYLGSPTDGVLLRRTECYLSGTGHIVPGCELADVRAPVITFSLKS